MYVTLAANLAPAVGQQTNGRQMGSHDSLDHNRDRVIALSALLSKQSKSKKKPDLWSG